MTLSNISHHAQNGHVPDRPDRQTGILPEKRPLKDDLSASFCGHVIDIVAVMNQVSPAQLRKPGRSNRSVDRARQIAMYVCHVTLGLSQRSIGRNFDRDRTTVAHACSVVEDMRDNPDFDRHVAKIEHMAQILIQCRARESI